MWLYRIPDSVSGNELIFKAEKNLEIADIINIERSSSGLELTEYI